MANIIEVDISKLDRDIGNLTTQLEHITRDKKEMETSINVLDGMWDGMANSIFMQQFIKDMDVFDQMIAAVKAVIESLKDASKAYKQCENEVEGLVNSIKIG